DASNSSHDYHFSPLMPHNTSSIIFIRNKIDLINAPPSVHVDKEKSVISLSAKLGIGIDLLKNHIKAMVGFGGESENMFLARRRHLDALKNAFSHIKNSLKQLTDSGNSELAAEDLRLAQLALSEITGEFTADDLLGKIFST